MTVSTEVSREEYTGNGVTTDFDYRFRVFSAADLVVSVADTTETITVLTLNTDYTVTGAGSRTGGKVKLLSPLAFNWRISIERALPVTQETDIRNQGNFFPEVHEDAFDKLTMLIQQVWSYFGLALRKPTWLSKYYDALGNRIANLGNPINQQDAATKSYVDAGDAAGHQYVDDLFKRTLRVPENNINQLPNASARRNMIPAFDNAGNAIVVLPQSGSATDVMIKLAQPDSGRFIAECPSFDALRQITGLKHGDRIWLQGYNSWAPGQGAGEFVADLNDTVRADNGGTVAVTIDGVRLKRKLDGNSVTPEMFGAVRGGDASAAIQAALNAGHYVNGLLGRYRLVNQIVMPNASTLILCEFDLDNKAYSQGAIQWGTNCTLQVIVHGTAPTTLFPESQIATRSRTGSKRARVTVIADSVNMGTFGDNCKMCSFNVETYDISGDPTKSEGYGLLIANSSTSNVGTVKGESISRHGLYISSGSSNNKFAVDLSEVLTKAAVNINSRPNQPLCENNQISGVIADSYSGVNFFVESAGGANTGGAIRNNRLVDLTILCKAGVTQNAILIEATSECETAYGNGWRNVLITGTCESTTQPVVDIVNMPRFDSDGIKIRVNANYRILSIRKANNADMGTMRFRNVDILTLSSVVGVYNNVDTGLIDFDGIDVVTAGQRYLFSGATANNVVGLGRSEMQTVTATVAANGSELVPVVFKREYTNARANVTISSASGSTDRCNANYSSMTSTGCSVRLINGTATSQTLSASITISGL